MGKTEDLTGQRFGRLTVISQAPYHVTAGGNKIVQWNVLCDCGTTKIVQASRLKSGKTKSCGCYAKKTAGQYHKLDIIGKRFGNWTVLKQCSDTRYYHCRCDCGTEKDVFASSLTTGKSQSCGCLQGQKQFKDLTGQQLGRWTVQYRSANKNEQVMWHCRCSCGNEKDVPSSALLSGQSKSCGCYAKEKASQLMLKDLTGKKFGKLLVLYKADNKNEQVMWHCRCSCGNEKDVPSSALLSGQSKSCGCLSISRLEFWVADILDIFLIDYKEQVKFDDLTGLSSGRLSYDFGIYHNDELVALVECQGAQHYKDVEYFGGIKQLEKQQFHDELKSEYARKMNVPLIEISYKASSYQDIFDVLNAYNLMQYQNFNHEVIHKEVYDTWFSSEDLTGREYNEWTVISKSVKPQYWLCRCSCGNEKEVYANSLKTGKSKSCGCIKKKYDDIKIGQKYGLWTVIGKSQKNRYWLCQCSCGIKRDVYETNLKEGKSLSCGCHGRNE